MNKLCLGLALLFALSACSVGKKCTYTQDGTKLTSYVWFYNGDKPIDLDKNNLYIYSFSSSFICKSIPSCKSSDVLFSFSSIP